MSHPPALRVKSGGAAPVPQRAIGGPGATGPLGIPPWAWFLMGGVAVVTVAVSGLLGPNEQTAVFFVGVCTLAALVVSVRLHRPALTWPWWAIAASMAFFLVGGALRVDLHTLGNITPTPFPGSRPPRPSRLRLGGGGSARVLAGARPRPATSFRDHPRCPDRGAGHPGGRLGLCHRPGPVPLPHTAGDPARADVLPGHVDLLGGGDGAYRFQPRAEPRPRRTGSCWWP